MKNDLCKKCNVGIEECPGGCSCKTALHWISVKDRLPEKDGTYLIICYYTKCLADYMDGEWFTREYIVFNSFNKLSEWTQENTTHWMELPEMPK